MREKSERKSRTGEKQVAAKPTMRDVDNLPPDYTAGHCNMCQVRWGKFDRPEDQMRVLRELQDIQEWILSMRGYTNMTTPDGLDSEDE